MCYDGMYSWLIAICVGFDSWGWLLGAWSSLYLSYLRGFGQHVERLILGILCLYLFRWEVLVVGGILVYVCWAWVVWGIWLLSRGIVACMCVCALRVCSIHWIGWWCCVACMHPWMPNARIVNVAYHLASSSASTKGWYFPLRNKGGRAVLAKCEFNEL